MDRLPRHSEQHERPTSPSEKLWEFLEAYNRIMKLIGWIVECGPSADPTVVRQKRDLLNDLIVGLGLDPKDPSALDVLTECYNDTMARARAPQPSFDIPDVGFFEERINGIIRTRSSRNNAAIGVYNPTISEVSDYTWTDWSAVQSRSDSTSTPRYIRGVAQLIADPIAYNLVFPRNDDDMQVTPTWEVANGRHRSLAVACLGSAAIRDANDWVFVGEVPY